MIIIVIDLSEEVVTKLFPQKGQRNSLRSLTELDVPIEGINQHTAWSWFLDDEANGFGVSVVVPDGDFHLDRMTVYRKFGTHGPEFFW